MYLTFKIEIDQFRTNVNPKNGSETKSGNFPYGKLKFNIFFITTNNFCNRHLPILQQK